MDTDCVVHGVVLDAILKQVGQDLPDTFGIPIEHGRNCSRDVDFEVGHRIFEIKEKHMHSFLD
jgi:hypothetical protein